MTPTVIEWVQIAEEDFASATRDARASKDPSYRNAFFHAHQCAEKYLKARLQESDIPFPKTHDLIRLLEMCLSVEPLYETLRAHIELLDEFGPEIRYPGITVDKVLAEESLKACVAVRNLVRESLKLS